MVLERRGSQVKNEVSKGVLDTASSRSLHLFPLLGAETSIKPSVPSTVCGAGLLSFWLVGSCRNLK